MAARVVGVELGQAREAARAGWAAVATHSHMLRSGELDFESAKRNLVAWSRAHDIAAVGVGSPWEPVSAANYGRHETTERDRYYAGLVSPASVMDRGEIEALLVDLNRQAQGRTLFYLDNETPKNRHGHLWYVGFAYEVPAWHDYNQHGSPQFWDGEACGDLNAVTGRPHRRRSYMEIVARQRRAGALAVWAHPTSWWRQGDEFITNIAAELVAHLHADGFVDGMVVQGYDAFHRAYQALWFALLDRGASVPGYAELDSCFDSAAIAASGRFLNYLPRRDGAVSLAGVVRELRAARHYVSSGPHLVLTLDGHPMGARVPSGAGYSHRVTLEAWPAPGERLLSRVELIGPGGIVLAAEDDFPGGTLVFAVSGVAAGGYVVGRAWGEGDRHDAPRQQDVRHCALTNPVYLETSTRPRVSAVVTRVTLNVAAGGGARGAAFRLLDAAGETLESGVLRDATLRLDAPASGRLVVEGGAEGSSRDIPLAMANPALRAHIEYLSGGGFLQDWPACQPGEVPVAAFRFDAVRDALGAVTLTL